MVYMLRNVITKDLKPAKMAKIGAMFAQSITTKEKDSHSIKALALYVEGNLAAAKPELETIKRGHEVTLVGWARFGADNMNMEQKANILEWSANLSFTESMLLDIAEAPNLLQIYDNLKFSLNCYDALSHLKGIGVEWKETAVKKAKTIYSITKDFALAANFDENHLLLGKSVNYPAFINNLLSPPEN
ncbi:hypothetical protein COU37_00015 [Candidatus Micrarchaeota archaeon CG10_big_fil_rev_8_21_14_0_10_45_29]|nr:MAG: hypothetical protein COU37_00015 [Candidatus Micrarchaeota archaeon CG10_big_fil_rev_8_21_14_0_10_45_29]